MTNGIAPILTHALYCSFEGNDAQIIGGYQGILMLDAEQWRLFSYADCNTTVSVDPSTNETITEQTVQVNSIFGQFVNCEFWENRRHPAGADIVGLSSTNITAGSTVNIFIQAYDYCGQPLGFGNSPDAFVVTAAIAEQATNISTVPEDLHNGTYLATMQLNISGTYTIELLIYSSYLGPTTYMLPVLPGIYRTRERERVSANVRWPLTNQSPFVNRCCSSNVLDGFWARVTWIYVVLHSKSCILLCAITRPVRK
jgi:hypothetical protein